MPDFAETPRAAPTIYSNHETQNDSYLTFRSSNFFCILIDHFFPFSVPDSKPPLNELHQDEINWILVIFNFLNNFCCFSDRLAFMFVRFLAKLYLKKWIKFIPLFLMLSPQFIFHFIFSGLNNIQYFINKVHLHTKICNFFNIQKINFIYEYRISVNILLQVIYKSNHRYLYLLIRKIYCYQNWWMDLFM